jgi:peroxiredoxin
MKSSYLISVLAVLVSAILFVACSSPTPGLTDQSQKSAPFEIQPADGVNEKSTVFAGPSGASQAAIEQPEVIDAAGVQEVPAPAQKLDEGATNPPGGESAAEEEVESQPVPEEEAGAEQPAVEGPLPPVDPSIGNLAPDFTLTTLDGETVTLAELRGRPVLLNYWVTWCIPCRDEMPVIQALQEEYKNEGLVVLSINGTRQDALKDVENLISEFALSFPVLLDESEHVYNGYRILFMPTSFFIDKRGVIQDIVLGSTDENGFRTRLERIVASVN